MEVINQIDKCDLNSENSKILKKLNAFLSSKTSEIKRENGENVMTHFEQTSEIYMEISEKPYLEGFIAALLHDAIEDGYLSFDEIKEEYGIEIAIIVKSVSKKKEFEYLTNDEREIVLSSNILNEKLKITNDFRVKNKKGELSDLEKKSFNLMNISKDRRNKDYFGHIKTIKTMSEYIGTIVQENGLKYSDTKLQKLAKIALEIKYSDRIHNLKTQWNPSNIGKVERKTRETIKYFLDQSKEVNHYAYLQMEELIYILEGKMDNNRE